MSNDKPNGTSSVINTNLQNASRQLSSVHPDIPHIVSVLTETHMDSKADDNKDMSESDLAALFKQIDGANGVLNGVEDKLDGILNNLDTLLAVLEDAGDQSSGEGEAERAASKDEGKESAGNKDYRTRDQYVLEEQLNAPQKRDFGPPTRLAVHTICQSMQSLWRSIFDTDVQYCI